MHWVVALLCAVLFCSSTATAQTTWYVDDNAPSDPGPGDPTISDPNEDGSPAHPFDAIQEAIDISTNGDEVVVEDGTFTGFGNRDLDFGGRAITVRSASGNSIGCIIDCEGQGRGIYFHSGEQDTSVLEGFTVTRGAADWGAGVFCGRSSPTIRSCIFRGNAATVQGGGMYNAASSTPIVTNCTFRGNSAARFGGGMMNYYRSSPTVSECIFSENVVADAGAGMFNLLECSPKVTNCVFSYNSTTWIAGDGGGGMCNIENCCPTVTNCTFRGNSAVSAGGALYSDIYSDSNQILTNCILWDNSTQGRTDETAQVCGGSPVINNCCVQGWTGALGGTGNIDSDPGFAFADDAHLLPGSPCIDAGTNSPSGGLPSSDLGGNARLLDGNGNGESIVDMGAYETNPNAPTIALSSTTVQFFAPEAGGNPSEQVVLVRNCGGGTPSWVVTEECPWLDAAFVAGFSPGGVEEITAAVDVAGLAHGTYTCTMNVVDPQAVNSPRVVIIVLHVTATLSVPEEYGTIQEAIDASVDGDVVLLSDGVYTGLGNKNLDYCGREITVRSINGPSNCVIDCENYGRAFYFRLGERRTSIIDGLTVTRGLVDDYHSTDYHSGGAVFCCGSSPTIVNCVFTGNDAYMGGAVGISYGSAMVTNCSFCGNHAISSGGGILNYNGGRLVISNCEFRENSSWYGGAICDEYSNLTVTNCVFTGNSALYGGGIQYEGGDTVEAKVANCVFVGNSADYQGGGLSNWYGSLKLANCVLWANSDGGGTDETAQVDSVTLAAVDYCCIQGWTGNLGGVGNINADPLFSDPDGPDNDPDTYDDNDYSLTSGSPCIDAGSNGALPADTTDLDNDGDIAELLPFDLDGQPRFIDDPQTTDTGVPLLPDYPAVVDMGAYEYQPNPADLDHDGDVDLDDFFTWQPCLTGPTTPTGTNCQAMDIDNDGDVDLNDFARFQAAFGSSKAAFHFASPIPQGQENDQ